MTPCSLKTKLVFSGQIALSTMFFILSNFLLVNREHIDRNHLHFFVALPYDRTMERLVFYYRKVASSNMSYLEAHAGFFRLL